MLVPTYDIFGTPIYSKEELKEMKKKEEQEAKAKAEAEQKKKEEAEKLKSLKKDYEAKLKGILGKVGNPEELEQDIKDLKAAKVIESVENIFNKYKPTFDQIEKEEKEAQKVADEAKKKAEEAKKNPKYKYPFVIHYAGRNIPTDHMFEHGQEYTAEQIRTRMLENQFYEFSGKVKFEYLEKDNVLLPIFEQHKKG